MDGYIKLYRKILDNPVFQNERLLKIFIWCLLKASYKEHEQIVGLQTVLLKPGQFIYGRYKAAQELKIKPSTLNDHMNTLKRLRIIDIKPNNKFSIVTIANWALYQSKEEESDNKSDNKATANRQQADTNNKGNKGKNVYTPEFEKFYSLYPNPQDKQRSFTNWKKRLKENTAEELTVAAINYKKVVEKENRERQYIKSSANFIGQDKFYKDYLPKPVEVKAPLKMVFKEL